MAEEASRIEDNEPSRQERILVAAGRLFAERGYRGVGINEVGGGANITGPGVYRHFRNKEGILIALFKRLTERLRALVSDAFRDDPEPGVALERLIAAHARVAIEERDLIIVYVKEQQNLPESERVTARQGQREYIDVWTELLSQLRSDLSAEERRIAVHAAIWLLNSVHYRQSYLSENAQMRMLARMARAALMACHGDSDRNATPDVAVSHPQEQPE